MGYISQPDLVQNMTPEQRLFVAGFYAKFDIGSNVPNRKIKIVEELFYEGLLAGSEFLTANDHKLYLCLSSEFSGQLYNVYLGSAEMQLHDENDVAFFRVNNFIFQYVGATLELVTYNNYNLTNHYFSRVDPGVVVTMIKFIGYRITLGTGI